MIYELRILVKAKTRTSRKSITEMIDESLRSTEMSMTLPFKVQDIPSLDNHFLKNLREAKTGSFIKVSTHDRVGYTNFAKSLGLDIVFRHHSEGWLKLYVIDTTW